MPQPLSMLFAISVRSTAMRSLPSALLTMPSARACAASACFSIAPGLLIVVDLANFAASSPATLPNTIISVSEFEPSRLAPWMPTLEHSPTEYSPGSVDAVLPSAMIPPMV